MSCMWQRLVDSVIYLCELWRHQFFWWQQLYQLPLMNSRPYVTPWCLTPCQSSYLKLCSHSSGGTCDYDDLTNGLESAKLTGNSSILTRTFMETLYLIIGLIIFPCVLLTLLTGHTILEPTDKNHIDALLDGPIAVAVQTTNSFLFYSSGLCWEIVEK